MLKELEDKYPEGSDLTLFNTFYQYPIYQDGKKISDDFLVLVYKDNTTGQKHHKIINKPTYTYYLMNDDQEIPNYNKLFIERDKVHPVEARFTDLEKSIAENTNNLDYWKQNIYSNNRYENKKLHTLPQVFFSDVDIQDHYRFKFAMTYKNEVVKLNKGFFDIEVDGKFAVGDFVQMGECEINCVSYLDEKSKKVHVFILRNHNNPLIEVFENEISSGFFGLKQIREFIKDAVGGEDNYNKYGLGEFTFDLLFYDHEIELIEDLFRTIHMCDPDFVEGWNSSGFDLEYIIARIQVLGYDPAEIMCDKNWNVKVVKNFVDERNKNEFAERGDYTFISGNPVFIDQMIQYASRRKSKIGSFASFKLDDIGLLEAGVQKLDYSHITDSVTELPWLDFKTFVLYNIMDTVVQKCIENKTQDLEYIFAKCLVNNTSYRKGHRQTIYLINRMASDWYKMGYIIGNNSNRNNPKPPKFLGALVHDPTHNNDYSRLKIGGRAIWICDNLQDYDYKALYPSITLEFNIAPNTQIGKIEIPDKVYENENQYCKSEEDAQKYSRSGEFIENMVTDNEIEFCKRWFHLAGFNELLKDADEYFANKMFSNMSYIEAMNSYGDKIESPLIPTSNKGIINPLVFGQYTGIIAPLQFNIPDEMKNLRERIE
jgi:DNA polymerase elongation subunit (family B)